MRKAAGVLAAVSLMIPTGILVTAPAGAATPTTKCKTLKGTQKFNPALGPTKKGTVTKGTAKITWNNGKTSRSRPGSRPSALRVRRSRS